MHLRSTSLVGMTAVRAAELHVEFGKLVRSIVKQHPVPSDSHAPNRAEDLLSIGNVLMLQAAITYDPDRGTKLSSWIAMQVRQGLGRLTCEGYGITRQQASAYSRGEEIDPSSRARAPLRLDAQVCRTGADGGSFGATLLQETACPSMPNEDELVDAVDLHAKRRWIREAAELFLTEQERVCLFTVLDGKPMHEAGKQFKLTTSRIQQIVSEATRKMQDRWAREQRAREILTRRPT